MSQKRFFMRELYIDRQPRPCLGEAYVWQKAAPLLGGSRSDGLNSNSRLPLRAAAGTEYANEVDPSLALRRADHGGKFCRMDKPRPHSSEGVLRKPPTSLTVKIKSRRRRKKKNPGSEIHKASSLRVCKARLKDMQWQEHGSPLPTVLPSRLYAYTESDPAPPITFHLFLRFSRVFPYILFTCQHGQREERRASLAVTLRLRPALPSVYIRNTTTHECAVYAVCGAEADEAQTQPLAPWAENGFTHSISSASIMTVW